MVLGVNFDGDIKFLMLKSLRALGFVFLEAQSNEDES